MNGKTILFTRLAAAALLVCISSFPANAKTKKVLMRCNVHQVLVHGKCAPKAPTPMDTSSHGGGGGGGGASDIRLKHDLQLVGKTVYGLPLYDFEYNGQQGTYEGVMAHDVLKVMPEVVTTGADGYYRVDYQMLGLN